MTATGEVLYAKNYKSTTLDSTQRDFRSVSFGLAALGAASAQAGEVTNLNDDGPGSLRQAIADAAPGEVITFVVRGTIVLTSGPLAINNKNIVIEGPGTKGLQSAAITPAGFSSSGALRALSTIHM